MTPAEYGAWVMANWSRRRASSGDSLRDLYIMTVGLGGEAGEVQELLKKHVRDGRLDTLELLLELGDVLHYLTRIAGRFGFTLDNVMQANVDKIEARARDRGEPALQVGGSGAWPQKGDLVRYGSGSTALAILADPHAGGWHGDQCMGGSTFFIKVQQPTVEDMRKWLECAPYRAARPTNAADAIVEAQIAATTGRDLP